MALETELDDDGDIEDIPDDDSEDSECEGADDDHGTAPVQSRVRQPPPVAVAVKKPVASDEPSSYLVERMNQRNGTIFYQTRGGAAAAAAAAVAAAKSKRTSKYITTQILFLSTLENNLQMTLDVTTY